MAALGTTRAWIAGAMSSTRGGWKDVCVYVDGIYFRYGVRVGILLQSL